MNVSEVEQKAGSLLLIASASMVFSFAVLETDLSSIKGGLISQMSQDELCQLLCL